MEHGWPRKQEGCHLLSVNQKEEERKKNERKREEWGYIKVKENIIIMCILFKVKKHKRELVIPSPNAALKPAFRPK